MTKRIKNAMAPFGKNLSLFWGDSMVKSFVVKTKVFSVYIIRYDLYNLTYMILIIQMSDENQQIKNCLKATLGN
jgi:hypothetical protein